jgi:hypothetical protein
MSVNYPCAGSLHNCWTFRSRGKTYFNRSSADGWSRNDMAYQMLPSKRGVNFGIKKGDN